MGNTEELLSTGSAARLLGVSVTAIASWAEAGRIAFIRLPGGARRFDRDDVLAFRELMRAS